MKDVIVGAAYKVGDVIFSVQKPGRHHSIKNAMLDVGISKKVCIKMMDGNDDVDDHHHPGGFITSWGDYVPRSEALRLAVASGQMDKPIIGGCLTSEDLW